MEPKPGGKKYSNRRLPFEIIEIGAVKLNERKETVDTFHRLIKPQVYNWIHNSIREVIRVNYKDLETGTPFPRLSGNLSNGAVTTGISVPGETRT